MASTNGRASEIDPPTHESDMRPNADEEETNKMSIDILLGSSRLQLHYIITIIYIGGATPIVGLHCESVFGSRLWQLEGPLRPATHG
jgi:hypothetical protein